MVIVLSLLVPHPSFFCFLWNTVLRDCCISWVSSLTFLTFHFHFHLTPLLWMHFKCLLSYTKLFFFIRRETYFVVCYFPFNMLYTYVFRGSCITETNKVVSSIIYFLYQKRERERESEREREREKGKLATNRCWLVLNFPPHGSKFKPNQLYIRITKTRLFKYIQNFTTKKWKFSDEKFW